MTRRQPYCARTPTTHTSLLVERRQCDEVNQCLGMIRRPWWSEANGEIWPGCWGLHSSLFSKDILGFLPESQDLGLTSLPKDSAFYSIVSLSLYWGVRTPHRPGWAPPAGLTNTSSNSNLVFPGGLPSRYWPDSTLLSFSGQPVLGCRGIWLLARIVNFNGLQTKVKITVSVQLQSAINNTRRWIRVLSSETIGHLKK